ncbi:hypothetical protein GALMADRAFT_238742 [Galerina marginata CBS 339.88]|uniref:Uncharacterized protein n=1 Tax=Galerina marginata (strain CBS 339.88) TaxID=685588 RepID=A0A067TSY5_GALM3|nr:hypothetical protein GALMADRAFT_238742 [Galerina marginata CBS 339.88]
MSANRHAFQNPALEYTRSSSDLYPSHSSDQIKLTLGYNGLRNEPTKDISMQRDAERYKAQQQLALAHARSLVCVAHQCAAHQKDQEDQLLQHLSNSGSKQTPQTSFDLAILARNTLVAEEDLVALKIQEYEVMFTVLQDAVEQARAHVKAAQLQIADIADYHHSRNESVKPTTDILNSTISKGALSSYQSCLRAYLPNEWHSGTSMWSALKGRSPYSDKFDEVETKEEADVSVFRRGSSSLAT